MSRKVFEEDKRFVTMKRYQEISGLSYHTVNHLLESGQIPYITTEGGHRRIDTQPNGQNKDTLLLKTKEIEKMLKALCSQFNVQL